VSFEEEFLAISKSEKSMSDMNPIQGRKKVGAIWWGPHGHNPHSRGYDGQTSDNEVALIIKFANHRNNPTKVYELQVLREGVGKFQYVRDAREKADEVFRNIRDAREEAEEVHSARPQ
jgi:hypothetical protein